MKTFQNKSKDPVVSKSKIKNMYVLKNNNLPFSSKTKCWQYLLFGYLFENRLYAFEISRFMNSGCDPRFRGLNHKSILKTHFILQTVLKNIN